MVVMVIMIEVMMMIVVMIVMMMIMIIVMCDDHYSHLFASAGLKARLYPKAIQRKVIKQQIDAI
jgi:hypothetical protein